jgi:hypothetical protein
MLTDPHFPHLLSHLVDERQRSRREEAARERLVQHAEPRRAGDDVVVAVPHRRAFLVAVTAPLRWVTSFR